MLLRIYFLSLMAGILCSLSLGANKYVATTGSDSNSGTIDAPYLTITTAVANVSAGDTIFVRGGTYTLTTTISISKSGTSSQRYYLFAYNNERPILDFSGMAVSSSNYGIKLSGSYWHIKGIDIKGAGDNGMYVTGSNNIIEFCAFYENRDTGLQLSGGASYNRILNCDSYFNADPSNGNADGFAPKLTVGTGNYFYGCRAWQNSDDGWDGYLRGTDNVSTTLDSCWCFMNGYLKSGAASSGNGNGFKMGGMDALTDSLRHHMTLRHCLAFDNRVKGFDENNNRGTMTLYNCTAYRNGTNYGMPGPVKSGEAMILKNCVALGSTGSLWSSASQQTNSWLSPFNGATTSDFLSIDTTGVRGPRKPDGSLPDVNFMRLSSGSRFIDAGTNVGLPFSGSAPDLGYYESPGVLAVELISFTSIQHGTKIILSWRTATESNSSHFEIYRHAPDNTQWHYVGNIQATGNSAVPVDYTFVDTQPSSGKSIYELFEVDSKGTTQHIGSIEIEVYAPRELLLTAFPNPFNPSTTIQFSVPSSEHTTLTVYNSIGQRVVTLFDGVAQSGEYYTFRFDGKQFSSGVYHCVLETAGGRCVTNMVLLK